MNQKLKEELYKRINSGKLHTDIDLHVHSRFSDGSDTAEEMVQSAIRKGIKVLGLSEHSVVPKECWCMTPEEEKEYRACLLELKEKYKGSIEIYCGTEQDALSGKADSFYDYVIGSAHAVKAGDSVVWVDSTEEEVRNAVEQYYGGDYYAYAETYYEGVAKVYEITGCDIVGHFDLLTKFNEDNRIFDTAHPRYINAWKHAADSLSGKGLIFEINTGGIARGYRSQPYPSKEIIDYLKSKGEAMILCSDSHSVDTLKFEFDKWSSLV